MMSNGDCEDHAYLALFNDQRKAYDQIHKLLEKKENKVILIDAPSGTGKTFLLTTLAAKYYDDNQSVHYITFRKDQASEISLKGIAAYTYVSYNMHKFHLPYSHAIRMFHVINLRSIDILYKLITYVKNYEHVSNVINTIILDIYNIASPIMLLLLYITSLKNNIKLIFAGDKMQLDAISKCGLHRTNNFYIAEILCDETIDELTANIRFIDKNFMYKLSRFRDSIESYKSNENVPFHFNLRYLLYCLFKSKYFTEESFDTVYMAQYHHDITDRLHRFIDHLQSTNTQYIIEPFYLDTSNTRVIPKKQKNKFFPGLLLVVGYKYIYIDREGVHNIVRLEKMNFTNNQLVSLVVRFQIHNDTHVETIHRCALNYYQILPAYRTWLTSGADTELWQFPLRMYTLTYHAALGRTIINDEVELSTDCSIVNSVYAGLCSIPAETGIHKIHANESDLLSFLVTSYMENKRKNEEEEFYYRCPPNSINPQNIMQQAFKNDDNDFIDRIKWITVSKISMFENKKSTAYLRILRSAYINEQSSNNKPEKPTELMKLAQFMKHNPNVVLDTIKAIPVENSSIANKEKASKKSYKESKPYTSLKEAYTDWEANNEKK